MESQSASEKVIIIVPRNHPNTIKYARMALDDSVQNHNEIAICGPVLYSWAYLTETPAAIQDRAIDIEYKWIAECTRAIIYTDLGLSDPSVQEDIHKLMAMKTIEIQYRTLGGDQCKYLWPRASYSAEPLFWPKISKLPNSSQ